MTVYLLYEKDEVWGIFSSEEKANTFVQEEIAKHPNDYDIKDFYIVDDDIDRLINN